MLSQPQVLDMIRKAVNAAPAVMVADSITLLLFWLSVKWRRGVLR
jgi:hypothetical protein